MTESLLVQDSFLQVSKPLLCYLDGDATQAILLTELIWLARCFKESDQMKQSNGWFFRTVEDILRDTCISSHRQKVVFDDLQKKGFIEVRLAGRPAKRYFKVHLDVIEAAVFGKSTVAKTDVATETKQDKFYKELNEAITKEFSIFKTKIDNLKKPFAAFIYTWNKLYFISTKSNWVWTPKTIGKLNLWYNRNVARDVDFSRLADFFASSPSIGEDADKYIDMWIKYDKSNFEKAPSERVLDPQIYWGV